MATFLASLTDHDVEALVFGGKGMGNGRGSASSKGTGRKLHPAGMNFQRMTCNSCGIDRN
eukprot:9497419-Pyramimonas_sp.AAC.1